MPEAAKNAEGVLKDFFILIQHFQADFDKIMDDQWLQEQDAPDSGVPSLKGKLINLLLEKCSWRAEIEPELHEAQIQDNCVSLM